MVSFCQGQNKPGPLSFETGPSCSCHEMSHYLRCPLAHNNFARPVQQITRARINTFAEAKAVSEAISAEMERDVGFAGHVCPFAYRLGCVEGDESQAGRGVGSENKLPEAVGPDNGNGSAGNGREEGFCDKGDVGSGEKLLYLLQKWDVRHRVLLVTRIDGGFAMAELLGVRRYGADPVVSELEKDAAPRCMCDSSGGIHYKQSEPYNIYHVDTRTK